MTPNTSVELERSVLASLLTDQDLFDEVADIIRPEMFAAAPAHVAVAPILISRRRSRQAVDAVLLTRELGDPGILHEILGTDRGDVRAHTEALHELWLRRELGGLARDLQRQVGQDDPRALLDRYAARLGALELTRRRPSRLLGDVIADRIDLLERQWKGEAVGEVFPTGISVLDSHIGGLRPGHLLTIAARPGVGKTAMVSTIADNAARSGFPVTIFQLEDYADSIADRAISRRACIPSPLLRDGRRWRDEHWKRATPLLGAEAQLPIRVDDAHGRTMLDIAAAMRRDARDHGTKVFVLDNLAEVVLGGAKGFESRLDRELGVVARQFRDAAQAVGAAPVLCVHLNRELERRNPPVPQLSDLKNSGDVEDASHVVAMLYRTAPTELAVNLAKNRNGPTGRLLLHWDPDFMSVTG